MNKRSITEIKNPVFGSIIISEVGATMVGSIVQTYNNLNVQKGKEKGYFKFGGSTVVLIFEKDKVKFDNDLVKNSTKNLETTIKFGEQIGVLTVF
jgi:phosphatidylserine decarboxylase